MKKRRILSEATAKAQDSPPSPELTVPCPLAGGVLEGVSDVKAVQSRGKGKLEMDREANRALIRKKFAIGAERKDLSNPRIILFRVGDKKHISGTAQKRHTVPGPVWTPASSVGYVAGAIESRKRIYLASDVLEDGVLGTADTPAIYAREIQAALAHGYSIRKPTDDENLGIDSRYGQKPYWVLEPPPAPPEGVEPQPMFISEKSRNLFDNKKTWADFPYDLEEMKELFEWRK